MKSLLLHNGQLVTDDLEALLSQDPDYPDRSVYTSIRTYDGRPFRLDEHLIRLLASARTMGVSLRWPIESIRNMIQQLLKSSKHDPQFVKVVATPTNLFAVSRPLEIDHAIYQGVSVDVVEYERQKVKAKSIPDPQLDQLYEDAAQQGHHDVLLLNREGKLTEGSRSNLLWISGETLSWCDDALSGITQGAVLEWTASSSQGLTIKKTDGLPLKQLGEIDELFLTQTSRGIVPIIQVGEMTIGQGSVGPQTRALMKLFHQQILQST